MSDRGGQQKVLHTRHIVGAVGRRDVQREVALLGGFVVVVLAAGLVAALVPGAVAAPDDDEPRGFVGLREMSIAHGPVGGETVTLAVEARLQHRRGTSENVSVEFRAISTDSGLREATRRETVGTIEKDGEVPVTSNLTVPRSGGYRIEAVVYQDGERTDEGRTNVRGVEALTPGYADTAVEFHQFSGGGESAIPVIGYSIAEAGDQRTTLNVSTYLTNTGDTPSEDLRIELVARQADSNIRASERSITVGTIRPGQTARPTTTLTVPSEYNYYLDAVLWKDGVIVGTASGVANLDPQETISVNQTRRDVGLRVEDFERGGGSGSGGGQTPMPTEQETAASGPGFGVGAALVALLGGLVLVARRSDST
jgi:PGF-CTERM protein